ncbi:TIGR00730 family Rossman fold protein [Chryseolinea sp. H1M3-3]|uniref:LOG family protein n=1 Tax=Chryseolinea sp. H1M3-3 TaxID=3034144 RepID=UPI0023EB10CD|nr:TIGR00730 family Rossman fold protein [Chryseolinea sp. H1M3-3]
MKRVTIFCGSSTGSEGVFIDQAKVLGEKLAQQNIQIIYGGAKVGLMGAVADAAIAHGGQVIGVIPNFLRSKEIAHEGLTELLIVDSMHERKMKMHELSDGIIALPGGFGTLEELFEMLTWAQLGLHKKPIGLLNVNGFYDSLNLLLQNMVAKGFLKAINYKMLLISGNIDDLLQQMQRYIAPMVGKWITEDKV